MANASNVLVQQLFNTAESKSRWRLPCMRQPFLGFVLNLMPMLCIAHDEHLLSANDTADCKLGKIQPHR